MKFKEPLIYIGTIIINILLGFTLNLIFFQNTSKFIFMACGVILFSIAIVYIISKKYNFALDIYAYNIEDNKYLILNSIFIGDLISIPISMFISLAL